MYLICCFIFHTFSLLNWFRFLIMVQVFNWCSILNKIMIAISKFSTALFHILISTVFAHHYVFSHFKILNCSLSQPLNYLLMNNNYDGWSVWRFYFSIKSSFEFQDISIALFHIFIRSLFDHHYVFSVHFSYLALIFFVSASSSFIIIYNKLLSSTF